MTAFNISLYLTILFIFYNVILSKKDEMLRRALEASMMESTSTTATEGGEEGKKENEDEGKKDGKDNESA